MGVVLLGEIVFGPSAHLNSTYCRKYGFLKNIDFMSIFWQICTRAFLENNV